MVSKHWDINGAVRIRLDFVYAHSIYTWTDFKTELNNLVVNGARLTLRFEHAQDGPQDQCTHSSRIVVNNKREPFVVTSTREVWADELAAKSLLEAIEARVADDTFPDTESAIRSRYSA
ncbi:hypothetical protein C0991_006379 [Blastosporella zonata]|nr:hypothetical protein C0991_006379 [Blastosporella zonata]